jgi:hypothetical protein
LPDYFLYFLYFLYFYCTFVVLLYFRSSTSPGSDVLCFRVLCTFQSTNRTSIYHENFVYLLNPETYFSKYIVLLLQSVLFVIEILQCSTPLTSLPFPFFPHRVCIPDSGSPLVRLLASYTTGVPARSTNWICGPFMDGHFADSSIRSLEHTVMGARLSVGTIATLFLTLRIDCEQTGRTMHQ